MTRFAKELCVICKRLHYPGNACEEATEAVPAAPSAIRAWCAQRIGMGKNAWDDPQILEAYACADEMERQRAASPPVAPKEKL